MMITAKKVMKELESGLTAVCAWCEYYHNAKENGAPSCGIAGCGGPAVGKGFPKYKGIMENTLHTFCFICGRDADAGVEIMGSMLGVCNNKGVDRETCVEKLRKILSRQPVNVREHVVAVVGKTDTNGG